MTREHLLNTVWGRLFDKKKRNRKCCNKKIKSKIGPRWNKDYIRSVRGEGYIFAKIHQLF